MDGTPHYRVASPISHRLVVAVMLRKISSGSQSSDGMEWMSRLLTVVMTTRSQDRNPHEFFVESARAARVKAPPLSLLPANPARELATPTAA